MNQSQTGAAVDATTPEPPVAEPAVRVDDLAKFYGDRCVVDGLSFEIARGEVFALLGPNGAGKTTTIEILEGYRRADRGAIRVLGLDPRTDHGELMRRAGLMLQQGGIYPAIRVAEALDLFAHFYPNPRDPRQLLEELGLSGSAGVRYRQLSGGQQQRLSLALALIGRPELVFLDEPTAGIDPQARHATWEIIRSLQTQGVTVLLTTHFMDEAEELANRVAIIDAGRLVALDQTASLLRSGPSTTVYLVTNPGLPVAELAALPSARTADEDRPGRYRLETDDAGRLLVELAEWLLERRMLPQELRVGGESLEDVFLRLTGTESRS